MSMREIIGDYEGFFQGILQSLQAGGIDITGLSLSHLGYKTATMADYVKVRDGLLDMSESYLENGHNGRPIAKIILKEPLQLPGGFTVQLMELMPPKPSAEYPNGLEHLGVVIGKELEGFIKQHDSVLTGRQDQGKFCQPAFITFGNGTRVKFYEHSLKDVVLLEGNRFKSTIQ